MWRVLLVLALALSGCATQDARKDEAKPVDRSVSMLRDLVAAIRVEDGIGYSEAMSITKYYLSRFGRQDASISAIEDQGRYWEAQIQYRAIPFPSRPIQVDKKTGGVSWSQGPAIRSLGELLSK